MNVDLVDPLKLQQARELLGTASTRATLDLALELLLAQSELIETQHRGNDLDPGHACDWE